MPIGWPPSSPEDDFPLPNGAFYVPERDGDILKYLSQQEADWYPRGFKTFEHFKMLTGAWVINIELPQLHNIRIMYNDGRCDECYTLIDLENCEWIDTKHAGAPWTHKIEDLLNWNTFEWWEISGIDPKFLRSN